MAITVLERIAQDVLSALTGVTADVGGTTVALNVSRGRGNDSPKHLDAIIWQLSPERLDDDRVAADSWRQTFAVVVHVAPSESDATPVDAYNNAAAAALHAAITADVTRGGLAFDTRVLPTLYFPPIDDGYGGITFNFEVLYRHALDDPYTGAA